MGPMTPFAQMPATPEPIIAQVRRQLVADAPPGMTVTTTVLDHVAERAVRELWESRVKTFVPVLALRTAREMLRDQDLPITAEPAAIRRAGRLSPMMAPPGERPGRDVLSIEDDILVLDDRDVLPL
jgi:hypothetical protein